MGGSQQHFNKRQKELKRQKNRADKAERKKQRAANSTGGALENMMAYVDENGRLTSVPQPLVHPPAEEDQKEKDKEKEKEKE